MKRCFVRICRNKIIHFILAPVLSLVLVAVYIFMIYSPIREPIEFSIPRGTPIFVVADDLYNRDAIWSRGVFLSIIRLSGGTVQSGEYDIPRRASIWRVARTLARGRVATTRIVIPEGLTIKQVKQLLLEKASLSGAVECEAGRTDKMCKLNDGDIFPDTYQVARGTPRLAVLDLARRKMEKIKDSLSTPFAPMPKPLADWNQVITLASIVQKETPRASEMPIVASVYLNRLRKNMRLQADPTVVYAVTGGLGDMRGAPLLRKHLSVKSPYNTYMNNGLPPRPIANVGVAAIRAVLNPADTNYFYFVADGTGGHRFAKSYAEHAKNHDAWRAIKKQKKQ